MKFEIFYDNNKLIKAENNDDLYKLLSDNKSKIDNISDKWNSVKKKNS